MLRTAWDDTSRIAARLAATGQNESGIALRHGASAADAAAQTMTDEELDEHIARFDAVLSKPPDVCASCAPALAMRRVRAPIPAAPAVPQPSR